MYFTILLFLHVVGLSCATLRADFEGFLSGSGAHFAPRELKLRYRLYRQRRVEVDLHNGNPARTWDMALNKFTVMTGAERALYLGLSNETLSRDLPGALTFESNARLGNPAAVDNVELGFVTRPKDQRTCGSCWSFGATAAFEGAYARATGVLKSFSEKELLDCTYSHKDGCEGGWYQDAWGYIGRYQRLAVLKDAPYDFAKDRDCKYGAVPNGIKNARYVNYYTVKRTDSELERAVARAVVAVAMTVKPSFYQYGSGIYGGCEGHDRVHHAVTAVGYTKHVWKVKNSWGRNWGEGGYVRFSRGRSNNCRLADYAKFPVVEYDMRHETDASDGDKERTRVPNHGCSWGDDYPCSDMNCNYGCKDGRCWSQCNAICGITGAVQRCENCKEWCWLAATCSKHEDCARNKYDSCNSDCTV